ncbi:SAM-dependent methyltransferase [Nocardia suismassiliense]|uniref:SAM-dependent methyltransferase n=1 Tax=Nocardia suismassiliense TaxID=2077092 RepID=A0ABW6R5Z7_9NOCA
MPHADNSPVIRTDIPHSARIWNYWMGGKDYYEIDRIAGDAGIGVDPEIVTMAVQSRRFLIRAVGYLTREAGLRQFLDIGTGLPTMQNTHEVAQGIAAASKVVYIDNDPMVLVQSRALLTNTTREGVTTYIEADYNDPERIVADARNVLNFDQPIGVMFMGVLGHAESYADVSRIVRTVLDAVSSGSYLILWDGTDDSADFVQLCDNYIGTGGTPYIPRPKEQLRQLFDGLELVEPGFVSITQWRPDSSETALTRPISAYCAVARKP